MTVKCVVKETTRPVILLIAYFFGQAYPRNTCHYIIVITIN